MSIADELRDIANRKAAELEAQRKAEREERERVEAAAAAAHAPKVIAEILEGCRTAAEAGQNRFIYEFGDKSNGYMGRMYPFVVPVLIQEGFCVDIGSSKPEEYNGFRWQDYLTVSWGGK